jgi:hypothetical protein
MVLVRYVRYHLGGGFKLYHLSFEKSQEGPDKQSMRTYQVDGDATRTYYILS